MVSIYIRRINNGLMAIEEVPIKWRSEVEKELST